MNAVAWTSLGIATICAVADWIAVAVASRTAEYVLKPATLAALIGVALALHPESAPQRAWFLAALGLSLAGDVLLMLDSFAAGLGSFLLAHVAYIGGLGLERSSWAAVGLSGAVVAAVVALPARRLLGGVRSGRERKLAAPVAVYVSAISTMVAFALATREPLAGAGAALFLASDLMIGWNRFVRPLPWSRPVIMSTYHLAQAGLVLSLLR